MPPSPIAMLQAGQILGEQYRLVERLGRSPGRQTWRAVDLGTASTGALAAQPMGEAAGGAGSEVEPGLSIDAIADSIAADSIADPWDSGEMPGPVTTDREGEASHAASESLLDPSPGLEASETVILKLLAFSDEIDWDQVKLFEREAAVLQGLDHPALPRYRNSFSLEDRLLWFCLVQDDIPGQSLDQVLAGGGMPLTEARLCQWAGELLEILIYLHGQSPLILHRDIKPSNVIWGDDQRIYLIDLGAVQNQGPSLGASFTVVGTYGYTPLEQFGGRAVPASDLYALGATLVHLLTGMAPADLPQDNLSLQFESQISAAIRPEISPGFCRWLKHLLEPDVQRRMPSARAALMALNQLQSSPPANSPGVVGSASHFPLRQPGHPPGAAPSQWNRQLNAPAGQSSVMRSQAVQGGEQSSQASSLPVVAPSHSLAGHRSAPSQPSNASMALLTAPTPAALAPAGARLRLKRSPDLLLVEMPGEELGYVFAVLGVGFSIWALLTGSVALPFCLLFTLLGIFLATPQVLRFERRGSEIRFSLGKQLGGYLLRWGRRRSSGLLHQVFHTVASPAASPRSSKSSPSGSLRQVGSSPPGNPLRDNGDALGKTAESSPWRGGLQSNRRNLIVQTHQREIPISTGLSWQEGTWLVNQIYAWCDGE